MLRSLVSSQFRTIRSRLRLQRLGILSLLLWLTFRFCFEIYFLHVSETRKRVIHEQVVREADLGNESHLLENKCPFVFLENEEPSMKKFIEHRSRPRFCRKPSRQSKLVAQSWDGSIRATQIADVANMSCRVFVLGGSLFPYFRQIEILEQTPIQVNHRFYVNRDMFAVKCGGYVQSANLAGKKDGDDEEFLDEDDRSKKQEEEVVVPFDEVTSVDGKPIVFDGEFCSLRESAMSDSILVDYKDYLAYRKKQQQQASARDVDQDLSSVGISMLVLDSVSRAQFARHMRKTNRLMTQMGFVTMRAYNKIGDNSNVNLLPIVARPLAEAAGNSAFDEDGDVSLLKALPFNRQIDVDAIPFLWKRMKEDRGCATLFNDDPMTTENGLFHYPRTTFPAGFQRSPADIYLRPFYVHRYRRVVRRRDRFCENLRLGDPLHVWRRFTERHAGKCHFSFNFYTTISHDNPNHVEYLDDLLFRSLRYLHNVSALDSTLLIIMGDHGQRVHRSKHVFAGIVEERAPLMSIFVPPLLRRLHPNLLPTLQRNSHRLVSGYDVHETLRDIVERRLASTADASDGGDGSGGGQFGESLLRRNLSASRNCSQIGVPRQYCLCMESSRSAPSAERRNLTTAMRAHLRRNRGRFHCLDIEQTECEEDAVWMQPNELVLREVRIKTGKLAARLQLPVNSTVRRGVSRFERHPRPL